MACYLFYMSTGWIALGGSILTCFLTALPSTGASRHKQTLRFAGFILGACVLGLGAEITILPQIDTLLEFTLLFAFVSSIGAWVAMSGPRIAYSGFQIVLAYDLVNLNKFTINTSLVPARDAILGVILGIFAMWLVFDHLWAKSSTTDMRSLLLSTLREAARLDHPEDASSVVRTHRLSAESTRISRNFDKLRSLSDLYAFESFPKTREEIFLNGFVSALLPQLRAFVLVKTGLIQHRLLVGPEEENGLIREVLRRSSAILLSLAHSVERYSLEPINAFLVDDDEELYSLVKAELVQKQAIGQRESITEMRLCRSLLDLALHVRAGVRSQLESA